MLTVDEAYRVAVGMAPAVRAETIPVEAAYGRILAAPVKARLAMPPFPRALMDGYAVRASDAVPGAVLIVTATVYAGDDPGGIRVSPGTAVRIMTGAPLPEGADAVVRSEWTVQDTEDTVRILRAPDPGESVQPEGEDARPGATLLEAGMRLYGPQMAVCKSFGVTHVTVSRTPSVTVITTGSELVDQPSQPLRPGQVYTTNDTLLGCALAALGVTRLVSLRLDDDEERLTEALRHWSSRSDLVITTGGVSAGDRDYVRSALRRLDADIFTERVWMRPGTPMVIGRLGSAAVFGLAGNPAACLIQFEVFVAPVIRRALGLKDAWFQTRGMLMHDVRFKHARHTRMLRARACLRNGQLLVDAGFNQSSAVLSSLGLAHCVVRLDEDTAAAGTLLPVQWLSHTEFAGDIVAPT